MQPSSFHNVPSPVPRSSRRTRTGKAAAESRVSDSTYRLSLRHSYWRHSLVFILSNETESKHGSPTCIPNLPRHLRAGNDPPNSDDGPVRPLARPTCQSYGLPALALPFAF